MNDSTVEILPRYGVNLLSSRKSVGLVCLDNRLADGIAAPDTFGANAFDDAEESIKYMVLTNTWPNLSRQVTQATWERSHLGKLKESWKIDGTTHAMLGTIE
jgi:hypothetical protein